jgi:Holliday junction resolvase RusA-like endonuclease
MVHVYVPGAGEDRQFMRKLAKEELLQLDSLISTPCEIEYTAFFKTPSSLSVVDTFLAEIGIIRPPFQKPDWDNIGKKYCDMFNSNIWMDDTLVIDGSVHKYYSILPRVEIKLRYLNYMYNKKFYDEMSNRKGFDNPSLQYLDRKGEVV